MQNKLQLRPNFKNGIAVGLLVISQCLLSPSTAAELSTLFSTPQERQIINANRYKSDKVSPKPEKNEKVEQIKELVKEEVVKTFDISGITVSSEGQHSVWINDQMYLDGEQVEGKSRVNVIVGREIKVRIVAPDGKQYFGTSGESLEVKYLEAVDS